MIFSVFINIPGLLKQSGQLTVVLFLSLLACNASAQTLDRIVAVVNDDVVMMSELEEKIKTITAQLRENNNQIPPPSVLEKQVLDRLILSKVQLQMAELTGIRVDDETLNRSVSNIAAENGVSLQEFREILEADGYSFEKFREDIREQIAISRLKRRQIVNRVSVTEREIDNFLATQEHQGLTETQYRIAHILIATASDIGDDEKEQSKMIAEKVIDDLNAGADFNDMAATVSDGQQASQGGDLGFRTKNQIPTLFSDYIVEMEAGEIAGPIESPSGFHIIKLADVKSGEKTIVRQTLAKHILIKVDQITTDEAAQEKLQQLLYRIEQGEDFSAIAKSHSEDTLSALDGGSLGWRSPGELVPQFEQVMADSEIGEISEPFKTQFGWHILTVVERRDHDNTENARRTNARNLIKQRKIKDREQDWLRQLRDDAYVQYRLTE